MKLRFVAALIAAKILMLIYKIFNNERDDIPGLLACKICPEFLRYVSKPDLVVGVTGTNGKTSVASLIADILKLDGKSVGFNDWGANTTSGHARCLLGTVNIFNKPVKDAAVLEIDEVSSPESIPKFKPDYLIVTNICRDSIKRNAHCDYVYGNLDKALNIYDDMTIILNADDPVSFRLGNNRKKAVYYSIKKQTGVNQNKYNAPDISVCPECFSDLVYEDHKYRSIGTVHCSKCDFRSPEAKYVMTDYDFAKQSCVINSEYHRLLSDNIFNAYNMLSAYAFMKEYGLTENKIGEYLKNISLPPSRISMLEQNGVQFYTYLTKGQNVSAASAVFEYLSTVEGNIQLVLLLNEAYGKINSSETITWLYESDFEFLNQPNIKRIIVGGDLYLDYKLRLLIAGIPGDRIVCVKTEEETAEHVFTKDTDKVFILHDVIAVTKSKQLRSIIMKKFSEETL